MFDSCNSRISILRVRTHPTIAQKKGARMDRLQQIASEIIRLYRQQLNLWTLGKITTLKDADLLQYDRRRDRIELLRRELEAMVRTGKRATA